ncbi:MAG TPA: acylase [Vicinamibacterales bacterium]|jgi:acyl-homoserine-lactone acylase|nr:acylase [Vicinamibacterales bacterium]
MRRIALAFALCAVLVAASSTSTVSTLSISSTLSTSSTGTQSTEILWDRFGVPHIFAPDAEALFYAFGWAQMEAHGDLILRLYGEARGRSAEYWIGENNIDIDRWVRRMGVPRRAQEWYVAQTPAERARLDAFVAGINAYARAHADRIADDVEVVLPITAPDVIAHGQRVVLFEFVASRGAVAQATKAWNEPPTNGSNAWAIGPSRSASGHAILVANPHLPWAGFFRWFEAQLVAPGIDVTGAALVGNPLVGIAFNDRLGWTHTNNTLDGFDLYELTLNGDGYVWNGSVRPFEVETQTIKVRKSDGTFQDEQFVIKRSIHGPVVSEKPGPSTSLGAGKAIALRIVGLDQPHIGDQYWDMARATTFAEFEGAVSRLQNPFYTAMYADRAGRIMHLFGGRTPVRPEGKYDWSGIVPGDSSATLWTGTHPYKELPRVVDPPSGWLQNANDPPWTTTFPAAIDANAYPRYMAPRFMHFRAQRSARMLAEDEKITFDEAVAYKHSTRMELADRILDDLLPSAKHAGGTVARAAAILEAWDRSADATSRGAVLFERFNSELTKASGRAGPFSVKWSEGDPRTTPDGLADPAAAVAALERAAASLEKDGLALDVPWGDVYRLRRAGVDLPGNGGPSELGIFRVVGYRKAQDGKFEAAGGDSFMFVAEFATPVRALTSVAPGNWSQPGSPHNADQLALFAEKRLKPAWRLRADVEKHLERRETVGRQP